MKDLTWRCQHEDGLSVAGTLAVTDWPRRTDSSLTQVGLSVQAQLAPVPGQAGHLSHLFKIIDLICTGLGS